MSRPLKNLEDQVIVILGASSSIGMATAELAARGGASLVLAARSAHAMENLVERLHGRGSRAVFVPCDVSKSGDVERVAQSALKEFGRIDTWINCGGITIYGRLDEVGESDHRRLFDLGFWGVVRGSITALPHLKRQGGALINVGSDDRELPVPLQGMTSASKHAIDGYTRSLRVEVGEIDRAPVSVTLLQPRSIDRETPRSSSLPPEAAPRLPALRVNPQEVAAAILEAATCPVGGGRNPGGALSAGLPRGEKGIEAGARP